MNLLTESVPHWPPLAWLARSAAGSDDVRLLHGTGVEIGDDWFAEAVWDGPFEEANFDRTDLVYGSGGRRRGDRWVFAASSTSMDRLQYFRDRDGWLVSNSLACLLAAIDADVPPLHASYRRDFSSIILGLDRYHRQLRTTRGDVQLIYYDNLALSNGELTEVPKPSPTRDLSTYAGYREFLESALQRCAENMRSTQRRQPYDWLGTISTGFDSPTVAALARNAGLREVITYARARDGLDDDGSTIAEGLGLSVQVIDRDGWQRDALSEVPFLASDAKGEDVYFAGAGDLLQHRVLLTGYAAGAWATTGRANPTLRRADQSGLSLTEFRLWANFINLPVPTMGVKSTTQSELDQRSQELMPWASGNSYDKPFSRRVLTEAGIPATCFGQENKAASVLTFDRRSLLSEKSKPEYLSHLSQARREQPLVGMLQYQRDLSQMVLARAIGVIQSSCQISEKLLSMSMTERIASSGRVQEWTYFEPRCDYLFPWAMRHAIKRYQESPPTSSVDPQDPECQA